MTNFEEKRFLPVPVTQVEQDNPDEKILDETNLEEDQDITIAKKLCIEPVMIVVQKDARFPLKQIVEKFLLRIHVSDEQSSVLILLSGKAFVDFRTFANELGEYFTCLNFGVGPKGFNKFKYHLHESTPRRIIYACGGSQFGRFVYKNAEVMYSPFDVNYSKKLDISKNYDNLQNSLIDIDNNCRPELSMSGIAPNEVAFKFFMNLKECFLDPKTLLCFGAAIATVFWDLFQQEVKGFPVIFFLGETHSGKSTLMFCLSSLFGLTDNSIMSGTSTPFAITKELGGRICIPLFIEELDQNFFKKYAENIVKVVYSAIPRERGTKTGVEKLPTFTSFVATSNYSFVQPSEALLSRTLFIHMKKSDFVQENFKYFDESLRKDLSLILPRLLLYRDYVLPIFKSVYQNLINSIPNYSGDRYLRSVAMSCTMWILINKLVGQNLFNWQQMVLEYYEYYEKILKSKVTNADMMLRHISKLIDNKDLRYGVHYKLIRDVILRLNLSKFITKFNILYGNTQEQTLEMSDFCNYVANDNRFDLERKVMDIGRTISINIANEDYLLDTVKAYKYDQAYHGKYEDESEM